jgi:hypothetical protein
MIQLRIGTLETPFHSLRRIEDNLRCPRRLLLALLILLDSPTLFSDSICCTRRQLHDSDIVSPWRGVVFHDLEKISSEEGRMMPLTRDARVVMKKYESGDELVGQQRK